MRILFIGCTNFSYSSLRHVLSLERVEVVGIVTKKASSFNSNFFNLESLSRGNTIPCFFWTQNNERELAEWIRYLRPDIIYCFGWSHILKKDILEIPPFGVIGYHPAALPEHRGRHPIIWTLALGLTQTASTFFFINEDVDAGDIVSQNFLNVDFLDDASSLFIKMINVALIQITDFTKKMADREHIKIPQDHSKATYWRKRTAKDGFIDWRLSARTIYNLVRALTRPYGGAHCVFEEKEIKIWKSELMNQGDLDTEPGKVIEVQGSHLVVKCGEGSIKLLEHEFLTIPERGMYL